MYILVLKGRRRHVVWLDGMCWIFKIISINNNKNSSFLTMLVKLNKRIQGVYLYWMINVQERSSKISIYNKGVVKIRLRHPV